MDSGRSPIVAGSPLLLALLALSALGAGVAQEASSSNAVLRGRSPQQSTGSAPGQAAKPPIVDPPVPKENYFPDTSSVIQLSSRPRAFLFPNFLSDAECDYLVNYSRPRVERSSVVGVDGKGAIDDIRTSSGTYVDKWTNPVVSKIEQRLAAWTFLPIDYQEPMQVLKYVHGQKYDAHYDYYEGQANLTGGQRFCTVLMYLSDVEFGGETVFPNSESVGTKDDTWSTCGKQGVAVKPRKGDALLFFSMKPDGSFDATSLHSGCPVLKGEKWSATKWIHSHNYGPPYRDPDLCVDEHEKCQEWAGMGECTRNTRYMMGVGRAQSELGFCRKACGVCTGHKMRRLEPFNSEL